MNMTATTECVPVPTDLENIVKRLHTLVTDARSITDRQHTLLLRLEGPQPYSPDVEEPPIPEGMVSQLQEACAQLEFAQQHSRDQIACLEKVV